MLLHHTIRDGWRTGKTDRRDSACPRPGVPLITAPTHNSTGPGSSWAPFTYTAFAVLWGCMTVSRIGTWMHDVGAGWLMTELADSPTLVAAVQTASRTPIFAFAILAGAIADRVDRRYLLIGSSLATAAIAGVFAVVVQLGLMTPPLLLVLSFAIGTSAAFTGPAWQAVVPQLVERRDLLAAIALNSIGINVSRAIGPALAGVLIVTIGMAAPFAVNALATLAVVAGLLWWRPAAPMRSRRAAEPFLKSIATGLHFTLSSTAMRATFVRTAAYCLFASAFWALLPLVAREMLSGGPQLYGILLGSVGLGAVSGAFVLARARARLGLDGTVVAGTIGTVCTLALIASGPHRAVVVGCCAVAGLAWISVLSSLQVAAQTTLPDELRGRGMSVYLTVFFGAISIGSLLWGRVASLTGIPSALAIAAASAAIAAVLSRPFKLQSSEPA
ncbi:MAG: MFS transporter [Pseudomonadota bacterium]